VGTIASGSAISGLVLGSFSSGVSGLGHAIRATGALGKVRLQDDAPSCGRGNHVAHSAVYPSAERPLTALGSI
jgi:hypothetical protein